MVREGNMTRRHPHPTKKGKRGGGYRKKGVEGERKERKRHSSLFSSPTGAAFPFPWMDQDVRWTGLWSPVDGKQRKGSS